MKILLNKHLLANRNNHIAYQLEEAQSFPSLDKSALRLVYPLKYLGTAQASTT